MHTTYGTHAVRIHNIESTVYTVVYSTALNFQNKEDGRERERGFSRVMRMLKMGGKFSAIRETDYTFTFFHTLLHLRVRHCTVCTTTVTISKELETLLIFLTFCGNLSVLL